MNPKSRLDPEERKRRQKIREKASLEMKYESRGGEEIERAIKARLKDSIPLWRIYPFCHDYDEFQMYFFFKTNEELEASKTNGKRDEIEKVSWEEVKREGREGPPKTTIEFIYDSDENVKKYYEGEYQFRLR